MEFNFPLTGSPNTLICEVADIIKKYYPTGVAVDSAEYREHSGIQEIESEVDNHMDNYSAYMDPWKSFLASWSKGFKSKVRNTGLPHELSYSGDIVLEKYEDESLVRIKRLAFSMSWLAPFYTIYGVDETFIKENDPKFPLQYHAINVVTVSPYKEFETAFNYVLEAVSKHFNRNKFIPFSICNMHVQEVSNPNGWSDTTKVMTLLFNGKLDHSHIPFLVRGDRYWNIDRGDISDISVTLTPPPEF